MTALQAGLIEVAGDPATAMSRLARSGRFGDYMVYERPGGWVFAADPLGHVELDTEEVRVTTAGQTIRQRWTGRPVDALERALSSLRACCGTGAAGTLYGWVAFEFCAYSHGAERYLAEGTDLAYVITPRIEVSIVGNHATVHGATAAELDVVEQLLGSSVATLPTTPHPIDIRADNGDYCARVGRVLTEIAEGRYQKVILSRRVDVPFKVDLPATYCLGRANNNPARSFLMRLGGLTAAGFSPELVVSVEDGRTVTTEPLAGTRALGQGTTADLAARDELESDPKEIVEHAISVRTSCAEIASIAEPDSTSVTEFMTVRERGSVQHLASSVCGVLAQNRSSWDALEAVFPSVTASGIPKKAGVDAIFRHDPPRGLYSGAVITVSENGAMEATLVLRAVFQTGTTAWLRAGAGIISQSDPEREFEETCEKLNSIAPYLVCDSPHTVEAGPQR